ncbi:hypothetical protein ACQUY5_25695 [Bacillus cereus]|uniref:hypothetical protein n=1 Tax=Bacillus cereus TaxID=1396 RepID=UPI003D1638D5
MTSMNQIMRKKETRLVSLSVLTACSLHLAIQGYLYIDVYLGSLPPNLPLYNLTKTQLFLSVSYSNTLTSIVGMMMAVLILNFLEKRKGDLELYNYSMRKFIPIAWVMLIVSPIITCVKIALDYNLASFTTVLFGVTLIIYAVLQRLSHKEL